jgi:hypothetical protein
MTTDAAAPATLSFVFYRPSNEADFVFVGHRKTVAPSPYSAFWFTRIRALVLIVVPHTSRVRDLLFYFVPAFAPSK